MSSRVVIGALPGGGYGMKVSLPGINVLSVTDDDPNKLSFSSNWTNLAKIWMMGISTVVTNTTVYFTPPPGGGVPWIDARFMSGGVLRDDYNVRIPPRGASGDQGGYAVALLGRAYSDHLYAQSYGLVVPETQFFYVIWE